MSRRHRTNRIRTPRPRPAREAAPIPTDPVLPLRDFDVMVRVWLSVHKRTAPTVVKAFQAAGWRCEEVASLPNAVIGPGEGDLRSHWEVDVPLPGGASRATAEAERQIRTKVAQLGTVMACRGSVVLEPEGIHALTFRVHRIPPNPQGRHYWLRYLDRWRVKSGRLDTGQIVHAHSLTHARAEYRRRAGLPGLPTPVGNVDLRPEAFAPRNAHPTPGRYPLRESQAEALRIAAIPTAAMLIVEATRSWWSADWWGAVGLLIFGLALVSANYAGLRWALRGSAPHQPRGDLLLAAIGAAVSVGSGVYLAFASHGRFGWFGIEVGNIILAPLLLVFAVLTVVAAQDNGDKAGATAALAGAKNATPPSWGTLQPQYVCAYPTTTALPYQGDPLPAHQPLLTFDTQVSEIALWNPVNHTTTRVPNTDVALLTVADPKHPCPATAQ